MVTCAVTFQDRTRHLGVFDTWEGGNVVAPENKMLRGGMLPEIAVPSPASVESITITRDFDNERDEQHAHFLSSGVGKARAELAKWVLDEDDNPYGSPIVVKGIVIAYNHPSHDSDSGDVAMVGLVISPNSTIG